MKTLIKNPIWKNLCEEEHKTSKQYGFDYEHMCVECGKTIKKSDKILLSNQRRYHVYCFYKRIKQQLRNKERVHKSQLQQIESLKKYAKKREIKMKKFKQCQEIFMDRYPEMMAEEL